MLYLNYICPWAHRANIAMHLKGLHPIIQVVVMDYELGPNGWFFSGRDGTAPKDPLYGMTLLKELYLKANPEYSGRYTVPMLWDKRAETMVNNESEELLRMLSTAFDDVLPDQTRREDRLPGGGMRPAHLVKAIDELNTWVYHDVNNGVYKTGFAATQEAYEENVYPLFAALDRLEQHLGEEEHSGPFLFGRHITEADVRLYTTLIRFDVAYHGLFQCNLRMIRHDYPRLHHWLRTLYWDEGAESNGGAFRKTTNFDHVSRRPCRCSVPGDGPVHGADGGQIKRGYAKASRNGICPAGPVPHILPLDGQ